MEKTQQAEILGKYARVGNCCLVARKLNLEVAASLFETAVKRDKYLANAQNIRGTAMASLGNAITLLLHRNDEEVDQHQLLGYLADAGTLFASAHRLDTNSRKAFIVPSLDKKVKGMLDGMKTDTFLFGENLAKKIKSAKSIEKVGSEPMPQPPTQKPPLRTSNAGYSKRPPAQPNQGGYQGGSNQQNHRKFMKFHRKQSPPRQQSARSRSQSCSHQTNAESNR